MSWVWVIGIGGYGALALVLAMWSATEFVWKIRDRRARGRHRR